jgi:hypothetical protein
LPSEFLYVSEDEVWEVHFGWLDTVGDEEGPGEVRAVDLAGYF